MPTYPAPAPILMGDVVQINRFLQNPRLVQRRFTELTVNRFIADSLLAGRFEAPGGSLLYEVGESAFTESEPEGVAPGAEYPRTSEGRGVAALASITKWGQELVVTDEEIGRMLGSAVDRKMRKLANTLIRKVDQVALSVISAAVTQYQAQGSDWAAANAHPFRDVTRAAAQITARDEGYEPDAIVLSDDLYALLISDDKVIAGLARESANTVTSEGEILRIAGLAVLQTSHLPAGVDRLVVDTRALGGLGFERIPSPDYLGDPALGVESRARRDPSGADGWLLNARRPVVPIVQEPFAACVIGA